MTGETYGLGSLSEVGFSILQAIRLDSRRDFVIFIDEALKADAALHKESMRARKLVKSHLEKMNMSNVFIANSLEQMKALALGLAASTNLRNQAVEQLKHAV